MKAIVIDVDNLHPAVIEQLVSALTTTYNPHARSILNSVIDKYQYRQSDAETVYHTMSTLCEDISEVIVLRPKDDEDSN